jgi:hypothetical protein
MLRLRTGGLPKRLKYDIPTNRRPPMPTELPGYVTKVDLVAALIRELLITGELRSGGAVAPA